MMLILHHISEGSFKIMSDASHEPYHRNPLSQRRIPGFHARFQLRDILLTGFYILNIRSEIVLVKSMEVTQYHPIQCHRLIQFITAVLIFFSLCYLLRNKRTDGSQKTVCQRFTIHLTGSGWDANETVIVSPESWLRNILIGQTFYRQEFGKESTDVFLPDCFGFGYDLPTLAAHCGLIGFSSQKLGWRKNPFYEGNKKYPYTIGLWQGIDGSRIMMAHGFSYGQRFKDEDLSANEKIQNDPKFCPRGMMEHYNVKIVCTTDDPADSLEWHKVVKDDPTAKTRMLPTWRPDAGMNIDAATWKAYIEKLASVAEMPITCFAELVAALQKRHDFFETMGCKLSDHGIEEFYDEPYTEAEIDAIMKKALAGEAITKEEERKYKHAYLFEQGKMDYASGWAQQYHYGAIRNNNSKMFAKLGADTGFDSIFLILEPRST